MGRLYIPSKYAIAHRVLGITYDHDDSATNGKKPPTIDEIADVIQKPKSDIVKTLALLQERDFVGRVINPRTYACTPKGTIALHKEELLDEGWEKAKTDLLRWIQMIGIVSASTIGIATFIVNVITTNNNKAELLKMKQEVQDLKQSLAPARYYKANPSTHRPDPDSSKGK